MGLGVVLVIFGFEGILVIFFGFQGYFGHFLGFKGILVIFSVSGLFVIFRFRASFDHLMVLGYFGYFLD